MITQIFAYLPPKSLLALIRVNKAFRSALLAPDTRSIWKSTRESCNAPEPPLDMSEVDWARLLFGNHYCQICGAKGVHTIRFVLRRRICNSCIRRTGVTKAGFQRLYPGEDPSVLDLVVAEKAGQRVPDSQYYNRAEIDSVLEELRIRSGTIAREQYIFGRKIHIEKTIAHDVSCREWNEQDVFVLGEDSKAVAQARVKGVKQRLLALGFMEEDAKGALWLPVVTIDKPLTNHSWAMIKAQVIEKATEHRFRRLLAAPPASMTARIEVASQVYMEFKRSLTPIGWKYLPQVEWICQFPSIQKVMTYTENVPITPSDLKSALCTSKTDIDTWFNRTEQYAMNGIRCGDESVTAYGVDPQCLRSIPSDRAIIQFQCSICEGPMKSSAFSSVDVGIRHVSGRCALKYYLSTILADPMEPFHDTPVFSLPGLALVAASGLSMMKTSVDEMDDIGALYRCLACSSSFVGTWRECINHWHTAELSLHPKGRSNSAFGQSNPAFMMLDQMENLPTSDNRLCWSCNHCTHHLENLVTRADIVQHVHAKHGISDPHVPADFFYLGDN
ncbi:hypothetical protein VNI00_010433 [Paramarasmius palmivorus]|uniref:F-box domain-containing protein n=1 Tax=Paramarasmius palmivorus TaxID=297713 RepID=A0AAW0CGW2_9AGAR